MSVNFDHITAEVTRNLAVVATQVGELGMSAIEHAANLHDAATDAAFPYLKAAHAVWSPYVDQAIPYVEVGYGKVARVTNLVYDAAHEHATEGLGHCTALVEDVFLQHMEREVAVVAAPIFVSSMVMFVFIAFLAKSFVIFNQMCCTRRDQKAANPTSKRSLKKKAKKAVDAAGTSGEETTDAEVVTPVKEKEATPEPQSPMEPEPVPTTASTKKTKKKANKKEGNGPSNSNDKKENGAEKVQEPQDDGWTTVTKPTKGKKGQDSAKKEVEEHNRRIPGNILA